MTIKELYYFAINHFLLDKEIDEFIKNKSRDIKPKKSLDLDKVEYTFKDLIALIAQLYRAIVS